MEQKNSKGVNEGYQPQSNGNKRPQHNNGYQPKKEKPNSPSQGPNIRKPNK